MESIPQANTPQMRSTGQLYSDETLNNNSVYAPQIAPNNPMESIPQANTPQMRSTGKLYTDEAVDGYITPGAYSHEGKELDKDAAVKYALDWGRSHNPEYMPIDTYAFRAKYAILYNTNIGNADCANFVSQALVAGGFKMNDDWYYYHYENEGNENDLKFGVRVFTDKDGKFSMYPEEYHFSPAWTMADAQYYYFSNPDNGYIEGEVLTIENETMIKEAADNWGIEPGDLLYQAGVDGNDPHHVMIVTAIENGEIYFAGHTRARRRDPLSEVMAGEQIKVVRLKNKPR